MVKKKEEYIEIRLNLKIAIYEKDYKVLTFVMSQRSLSCPGVFTPGKFFFLLSFVWIEIKSFILVCFLITLQFLQETPNLPK